MAFAVTTELPKSAASASGRIGKAHQQCPMASLQYLKSRKYQPLAGTERVQHASQTIQSSPLEIFMIQHNSPDGPPAEYID
jgi:hypothetical protein